jgi:uncharacterized protein YceK
MTGCVGIPQRVKDGERPGYWKCTATDIGAGIHYFPVYTVPALIDLPFGFVVDVVCLPFDARNTRKQEADRRFWLAYFDRGAPLASTEDGRARLSFMGREAVEDRIAQSSPPLCKRQLTDLVAIGFAAKVAESQVLDEELILLSIGITNVLSDGLLAQRVANNPGTPLPILDRMVKADAALPQLIENPNMSPDLLARVADIVTKRIASGERFFQGPMGGFPYEDILRLTEEALARNPGSPASTLESLAREPSLGTVKALAENPNTPLAVLSKIASNGPNPYIKKLAETNLARREKPDGQHKEVSNQVPEDTARKLADPQH